MTTQLKPDQPARLAFLRGILASWGFDPLSCSERQAQAAVYLTEAHDAATSAPGAHEPVWPFGWHNDGGVHEWPASPLLVRDFWTLRGEMRSRQIAGEPKPEIRMLHVMGCVLSLKVVDAYLQAAPVHYALTHKRMSIADLKEYAEVSGDDRFVGDGEIDNAVAALRAAGLLEGWDDRPDPTGTKVKVVHRGEFEAKLKAVREENAKKRAAEANTKEGEPAMPG